MTGQIQTARPITEEQWVYWQKLVSDELDRKATENDRLRALIGAQDTHNCESDGCMQSELGGDGYRAEAKVWVDKYHAMKLRIKHLEMVMRECCDAIRDNDEFGALRMLEVALKD